MTETTITARKSEATSDAKMACAGLTIARHAGRRTLRTEFGMRTLNWKQSKMIDMTDHKNALRDYSTDSLVKILRDLQRKRQHDRWDIGRIAAIKSLLKTRGIVLS
jgi:hypothetical protein